MNYADLYSEAHSAGMAAGELQVPRAMLVGSPSEPFGNDVDLRQQHWVVPEGVCGFAWIVLPDGRAPFAKWARDRNLGHKGHPRGFHIWVRGFGQSMERKEAYARAFAEVLKRAGIEAYADSRMD